MILNKTNLISIVFISATLLFSCVGKSSIRLEKFANVTMDNDFLPAIEQIKKNPKLYGKANQLLFNMDIGVLYHYAANYDSSTHYLQKTVDIYDQLYARSITNEGAAFLINDNVRPYRSKPFELVLVHQLLALNYLAQNNVDDALVETRRTQLRFDEWERKAKGEDSYHSDGMFHYLSSISYDAKNETDNAMISLFKSIQAFQNGPVQLPAQIKDYAYYMFENNNRQADNTLLKITPALPKEKVPGLVNGQTEIIVIAYAGRGPALGENVWWGTYVKDGLLILHSRKSDGSVETMSLPAPGLPEKELAKAENGKKTKSGTTFHIKVALPGLRKFRSETEGFSVFCKGAGAPVKTYVVNDIERQTELFLENTRPSTIARSVIRVVLRTIAAQKAKEEIRTDDAVANLILNFGTDILTDQIEKADIRTCFFTPKTIQIARIPVNEGIHSVRIAGLGKSDNVLNEKEFDKVTVVKGEKKILFYESFR